ncbi:MAG: PAS domain-containing protein, partial [Ktedonobacteraceae bacterium]
AEQVLELQASAGLYTHLNGEHAHIPIGSFKIGMIGKNRKPHLTNAVIGDPLVPNQEWAKREGMVAFAGYPLLVNNRLSGVMAIFARHQLTEATLEAMATVANAIALGTEHQRAVEVLHQKQQTLEIALSASKTGTFRWNPFTSTLLDFDVNFKQLFGFAPNDPIRDAKDFRNRVYADDVSAILPTIEYYRQGGNFETEFRVLHPDGSIHWLYDQAKIEHDEQGEPLYLVGACTDITQRKQAEEELRESAERLRVIAESMPQKIFTTKPNGEIDYVNPQWEKFTGLLFEEMKGWGWLQFIHPSDVEENIKCWQRSIETGEPFAFEHRFRRADGVYRWHLSRAIPMRDAQDHITMWIGSSTDITEQKELAYQKEVFMSMTTHELKTPLTSIKGYIQLAERRIRRLMQYPQIEQIEQNTILEQILSMLNRSQQQLNVQNRLITDLLDASRMQEGILELHLNSCDLKSLVHKIVENYQIAYPHRQITLDLPQQAIPTVQVDSGRIEQVLSNYLTNALKYSTKDKVVQVGMACEAPIMRIWVADQGPGLSHEAQQHIWERFYRVPGITIQNNTGASLGLGLSICQGIISNHHGHVGVESTPGQGARFWFTLPLPPQTT